MGVNFDEVHMAPRERLHRVTGFGGIADRDSPRIAGSWSIEDRAGGNDARPNDSAALDLVAPETRRTSQSLPMSRTPVTPFAMNSQREGFHSSVGDDQGKPDARACPTDPG